MKAIRNFFTQMDKQALRAIAVMLVMFFLVFSIVGYGKVYVDISETQLSGWFEAVRGTVWALPLTILTFCLAAFIGVPQWMLIAGTVVAFGPAYGAVYSWISTMISASLDFYIGRWVGAERLKQFGGEFVNRIVGLVRKNGFFTSFTVRLVPTGPFVLVNMAAGVSRMTPLAFLCGTGLGIIPKILAVAFLGKGIFDAFAGQGDTVVLLSIGVAGLLLVAMLIARKRLSRRNLDERDEIGE